MKKCVSFILSVCMLLTILVGCGSTELSQHETTAVPTKYVSLENFVVETVPATTAAPVTTLEETIIFDQDGIKVTVLGLVDDISYGKCIEFLVENNTQRNIAFVGDNFIVNGICLYGSLHILVGSEKKAYGQMYFMNDLPTRNITDIATIVGRDTRILDADSYDTLHKVPFDIKTSVAGTYVQVIDNGENIIFNQDGITVTAQLVYRTDMGIIPYVLTENNTDSDIVVEAKYISINGFTVDGYMYDTVYGNTARLSAIEWYLNSFEENHITSIDEVTFCLYIYNDETHATIANTDEIKLIFE